MSDDIGPFGATHDSHLTGHQRRAVRKNRWEAWRAAAHVRLNVEQTADLARRSALERNLQLLQEIAGLFKREDGLSDLGKKEGRTWILD